MCDLVHMLWNEQSIYYHMMSLFTLTFFWTYIAYLQAVQYCCIIIWNNINPLGAETRIAGLIPWLLMSWRRKSPGHLQPWYWRYSTHGDPCLAQERISTTCPISALRNDIKSKYVFMHPKINSAQHGLILHETSSFPMTIITLLSPLPDRRPFHFPNLLLCIDNQHSSVLTSLSSLPICLGLQ